MFESVNICSFAETQLADSIGNFSEHGLCVFDIDSDGHPEICICTINGFLVVYKLGHKHLEQRLLCNDLGPITCLVSGDVLNLGFDCLIAISAEGSAHIFNPKLTNFSHFVPTFTARIPNNTISVAVADVDGDGLNELIIGLHNCALHIFKLEASVENTANPISLHSVLVDHDFISNEDNENLLKKSPTVVLPAQTWSVSLLRLRNQERDNVTRVLVINMGFLTLIFDPISKTTQLVRFDEDKEESEATEKVVHSCFIFRRRDQEHLLMFSSAGFVQTFQVNLSAKDQVELVPVWKGKLSGTLMFAKELLRDEHHYVILCSWEGVTFILDENWKVYQFQLRECVLGFDSLVADQRVSLVYITSENRLLAMCDIRIPVPYPNRAKSFTEFLRMQD